MAVSKRTVMKFKSVQNQAGVLVKSYLLADPFILYTSVLSGIFVSKMVYDLSHLVSTSYFRTYAGLSKIQRIEWNNRGLSTVHAIFIATMSLYFVFWSDLFSDHHLAGTITFRSSPLSSFALGSRRTTLLTRSSISQQANTNVNQTNLKDVPESVFHRDSHLSVGYFISDLAMICWLYPALGGLEYVIHHSLSGIAVAYSMFTGEGQLYTFMVLISEVTTPEINMRWFLDTAGLKRSNAYLINGVVIFFAWLVARILLFVYLFYHVYLHYEQVIQMHVVGYLLIFAVPSALGIMNLMWFGKIIKGLRSTLAKKL